MTKTAEDGSRWLAYNLINCNGRITSDDPFDMDGVDCGEMVMDWQRAVYNTPCRISTSLLGI